MGKSAFNLVVPLLLLGMTGLVYADPIDFTVAGSPESSVTLSNVSTTTVFGIPTTSLTAGLLLDPSTFFLNPGETQEIAFFTLTAHGVGLGSADISATLAFTSPAGVVGSGEGQLGWGTLWGVISGGVLNWDSNSLPDLVILSDGTVLRIDFESGIALGCGDTATVHAYVTNLGGAAVPEPVTVLLLGIALVGLGARRRVN